MNLTYKKIEHQSMSNRISRKLEWVIFSNEENTVIYDKEDECLYLTDKDYLDLMNQINQLIETTLDLINQIDYDYSSLINKETCFLYHLSRSK